MALLSVPAKFVITESLVGGLKLLVGGPAPPLATGLIGWAGFKAMECHHYHGIRDSDNGPKSAVVKLTVKGIERPTKTPKKWGTNRPTKPAPKKRGELAPSLRYGRL